jgi:hypothetical protein
MFSTSSGSGLGNRDGSRRAHLDAAFAAEALILVDGNRFFILHFEDSRRTNINTFFIAGALIVIDFNRPRHSIYLLGLIYTKDIIT